MARAGLALEARGDVFVTHLKRFDMTLACEGLAGDLATETWSPGTPSQRDVSCQRHEPKQSSLNPQLQWTSVPHLIQHCPGHLGQQDHASR